MVMMGPERVIEDGGATKTLRLGDERSEPLVETGMGGDDESEGGKAALGVVGGTHLVDAEGNRSSGEQERLDPCVGVGEEGERGKGCGGGDASEGASVVLVAQSLGEGLVGGLFRTNRFHEAEQSVGLALEARETGRFHAPELLCAVEAVEWREARADAGRGERVAVGVEGLG